MAVGFGFIALGAGFFGFLAFSLFRDSMLFGSLLAAMALFAGAFGLWILAKCVGELRVAMVVPTTLVEISANPLHPGKTVEVLVAQPGSLRSKQWRVELVCDEHTVVWGTAPDPYNPQGNIIQPYIHSRPLHVIAITPPQSLSIAQGETHQTRSTASIPADATPQSWSREKSVTWAITVQGDANGWPAFNRRFPVALIGETVPGGS